MQEAFQSHTHELSYQRCIAQSESICHEEKARQLRLQILLLEDDRDDLHAQLLQSDIQIDDLERLLEDAQVDSQTFSKEAEQLRGEIRLKNRELENLRVCLYVPIFPAPPTLLAAFGPSVRFPQGEDGKSPNREESDGSWSLRILRNRRSVEVPR
jgi:hypothetical protein